MPVINLHVVVIPLNEPTISIFFSMQFYHHRLVGFPTKPKKSYDLNFRAVKVFREGLNDFARQKIESKCLWLVYSSYHLLNLSFLHLTV